MPDALRARRPRHAEARFESLVATLFRRAGWKVHVHPRVGSRRADLLVRRGTHAYVIELKAASEGRRDRLVPLLAQAILEARAGAREVPEGALPLAIVAAPRIPDVVVAELNNFGLAHAMGGGIGVIDLDGLRALAGPALDSPEGPRPAPPPRQVRRAGEPVIDLFSDLNQWMLKVLLAPDVPEHLLAAPRGRYRNASQVAAAAQASVMTAFRFLRQLRREGFLDDSAAALRLVRLEELFTHWQGTSLRPVRELPARWIVRGDPKRQIRDALRSPGSRACLGLFAAAEALGLGFVHGVPPHIYVEDLRPAALRQLGLSAEVSGHPDVLLRVPSAPEAAFRPAVRTPGGPASDAIQVWLDVSAHPTRGREQAALVYRRVLKPLLKRS